jgi:hypothetical protein
VRVAAEVTRRMFAEVSNRSSRLLTSAATLYQGTATEKYRAGTLGSMTLV